MTSTAALSRTDARATTPTAAIPTIPSRSTRPGLRNPASGPVRRLSRVVAIVAAALYAVLALPSAAQAYHEPITSDPSSVSAITHSTAAQPTSTGWGLTAVLSLAALVVVAAVIIVVAQRLARQRHDVGHDALSA